MSKKTRNYLIASFIFIFFGSLWFLTDNINNLSNPELLMPRLARYIVEMLRTVVYMFLMVVSFVGLLRNKKMSKTYFVTFVFLAFHTLFWIPEFVEYIVNLFGNGNYVVTKFFGFGFTVVGVSYLSIFYKYMRKEKK